MKANFILQETTTTGTGALTLTSVSGWGTFADQIAQNILFKYLIRDKSSKAPIEVGYGYLDGSGNLVRSVIEATNASGTVTVGGTAATLAAGTKEVACGESAGIGLSAAPGVWAPTGGTAGYGDANTQGASSNLSITADMVYVVPFIAAVDRMVDAIVVSVTTAAVAGKTLKAAIYSIASDGKPGVKIAETTTAAADSTGVKVLTFASPLRLPARFYACFLCDGAPSVLGYATAANGFNSMGYNGQLIAISSATHSGATGLTFPTTWTMTAVLSNSTRPAMVMRCI